MSATTFFLIMIVTVALFSVSASLLARGMLYMLKAAFGLFKKYCKYRYAYPSE